MTVLQRIGRWLRTTLTESDADGRGVYWCHECGERRVGPDPETPDEVPTCPSCGDSMNYERQLPGRHCC